MTLNRRHFLSLLGAGTGAIAAGIYAPGFTWAAESPEKPAAQAAFTLPPLPYAYNALEPHIDERTMQFHHDKHHAAYVKGLNAAVERYPQLQGKTAEDLLRNLNRVPEDVRTSIRNNGGGHVNHTMFWSIMGPKAGGEPTGELATAIQKNFGSFAEFQKQFNEAGTKRFGSGWAWLVRTKEGKLQITSTTNQDNPLTDGLYPILGNDVWEHAYYLLYQNRRADYLQAWWNVVNWKAVGDRYKLAVTARV
ncbi:superoxide dismutase [Stenomitos frigidus]|uniref:Superoxide dismutase n=1 Tax=Stenomitos frigidus ULC18 TaxID=2107698 RepID=A0A2T1E5C2_9CYAN|nr:superoxide dismutase [Stenomitos frigidus]PSB27895.1 superoxide dismutase [Stenomitos frigidus ULC18]